MAAVKFSVVITVSVASNAKDTGISLSAPAGFTVTVGRPPLYLLAPAPTPAKVYPGKAVKATTAVYWVSPAKFPLKEVPPTVTFHAMEVTVYCSEVVVTVVPGVPPVTGAAKVSVDSVTGASATKSAAVYVLVNVLVSPA
jgi:hypothetical protein